MKFIKEFAAHKKEVIPIETLFTDDEFFEIKDIYTDLVDDVNLTDVSREGQMTIPMTSNLSYFSKMSGEKFKIDISIRTASLDSYDDYNSYAVPSQEDRERYNLVMKELQPFIERMKSMNYQIHKRDIDIKLDSWKYITAGIKISITK
jgi:putative intracellular protease/amidase